MSKTEIIGEPYDALIGEPYDALIGELYDALIDETGSLGYRWEERSGEERRLSLALYDHAYDAGYVQGERDGYAAAEAALGDDHAAKLRLVQAVVDRGPRFTDRHLEAAAEQVLDELRAALRGEGL